MHETLDPFDPNNWDLTPQPQRVYLDDKGENFVWVDEIDYQWAIQWRWHINKAHPRRNGKKSYAVRSVGRGGKLSRKNIHPRRNYASHYYPSACARV